MLGDDPPYLSVGTEVSAKYKGAFCEAKIRKVVRSVKCRVTYKQGLGTATVADDQIKGTLRVGASVEARHSDRKEFVEATINKIQDCSQYTVVFDDGDITTLRRTALCLKSGRHFAESETLDQLPLTHPEHFGNPVIGGRRGRRSRQAQDDSSEDEDSPARGNRDSSSSGAGKEGVETEPEIGRVVCVELGDKKKKDNWFPGLVVAPTAQDTVRIRVRDDYLVRSFKDARYYTVPKKEATEFTKELVNKVENSSLKIAVEKALLFLEKNELPPHWDRDSLFGNSVSSGNSDSDGELDSDSSDDEPREEKDHFVAQLYKFMDDRGTPINNCPMIGTEDIDLYRLFRAVYKLGGYNRVTNQNQWKLITRRLSFTMQNSPATHNLVKQAYKKFLHSFEDFYRKLGCTMVNHPRSGTRKQRPGRSLIRDKDRNTPVPPQATITKSEKEEDDKKIVEEEKKEKKEIKKEQLKEEDIKVKKREDFDEAGSGQESDINIEGEGESSSSEKSQKVLSQSTTLQNRTKIKTKEDIKKKAVERKKSDSKKQDNKREDKFKEEEATKTRSKSKDDSAKSKFSLQEARESRTPSRESDKKSLAKQKRMTDEDLKKRGRKRKDYDLEKSRPDEQSAEVAPCYKGPIELNDRLKVYYGPTHESKVTYEAKVIDIEKDGAEPMYLVHYTGWNTRYDEWIKASRIAQNFTQTQGRVKRVKATPRPQTPSTNLTGTVSKSSKLCYSNTSASSSQTRRKVQSVTTPAVMGHLPSSKELKKEDKEKEKDMTPPARSTTPLSIASSSSRTKSPATPANNRQTRVTRNTELAGTDHRRRTRRMSAHTDISVASESEDSETCESDATEPEQTRTRSRGTEERKRREARCRAEDRIKLEEVSEGDDDKDNLEETRKGRRLRRALGKTQGIRCDDDSDEEQPKGRDFDLNQIRSELKGFDKAVKLELVRVEPDPEDEVKPDEKETPCTVSSPKQEKCVESPKLGLVTDVKPVDSTEDVYEFKEPEPFEFEVRNKRESAGDKDKAKKRVFEEEPKSPKKKQKAITSPIIKDIKTEVDTDAQKKVRKVFNKRIDDTSESPSLGKLSPSMTSPCEEAFDKLCESPSFNCIKSTTIMEQSEKVTNNLDLLFSDLPADDDVIRDDSEDRLIISEAEVSEPEQEALFNYQSDMFHTTDMSSSVVLSKDDTNIETDCAKEESLSPSTSKTGMSTTDQKQNTKLSAMSRQSPDLRALDSKLLDVRPAISPILAVPAPISTRLPATSTIEEKLSAAAMAFQCKGKDSRKIDDVEVLSKSSKEVNKKLETICKDRSKEEQNTSKYDIQKKRWKEKEITVPEEEQHWEIMQVVIKQKEDELQQLKLKKDAELKKVIEAKGLLDQKKIQDSREEEWKNKERNTKKFETLTSQRLKEVHLPTKYEMKNKKRKEEETALPEEKQRWEVMCMIIKQKEDELQELKLKKDIDLKKTTDVRSSEHRKIQDNRNEDWKEVNDEADKLNAEECNSHDETEKEKDKRKKFITQQIVDSADSSDSEQRLIIDNGESQSQKMTSNFDVKLRAELDRLQEVHECYTKAPVQKLVHTQQHQESITEHKSEIVTIGKTDEEGETINSLLCEEEIPGSPAPGIETVDRGHTGSSSSPPKLDTVESNIVLMEMPFASAPTSGQSTTSSAVTALSMTLPKSIEESLPIPLPIQQNTTPSVVRQPVLHQQHVPGVLPQERRESNEAAPVMDNTPPTTPDSSISNISGSPREERTCGSSPSSEDNVKLNRDGFDPDNDSAGKGPGYSEDDILANSEAHSGERALKPPTKRSLEDMQSPKKRKRNRKHSECSNNAPKKSGRQSGRHTRHTAGSDSDDTSEGSNLCGLNVAPTTHSNVTSVTDLGNYSSRSPRPLKYNFYVELDPELDGSQRIAVLQQKLAELRKTYNAVKVELAAIERRRKKLRRRERDAMKAAKAEMQQACS